MKKISDSSFQGVKHLGIVCGKNSYAHSFADKHDNVYILKLKNIAYKPYIRLGSDLKVSLGTKVKKKSGKLTIYVQNAKEAGYEKYDSEDAARMKMIDAKVIVKLPSQVRFDDGNSVKSFSLGNLDVGEQWQKKVKVSVKSIKKNTSPLTVKAELTAEDKEIKELSYDLSSYGITAKTPVSKKVSNQKISVGNDKFVASGLDNWLGRGGDDIWQVQKGDKYYIFYRTEDSAKNWAVKVIVLDKQYKKIKKVTLSHINGYNMVGSATVDEKGNFYLVCGKKDKNGEKASNVKVVCFAKYDENGTVLKKCQYESRETGEDSFEMKKPFDAGNCALIVDTKGRLICHTSKEMYNGHQADQVFYIDTKSMKKLHYEEPYVSHSFEQQIYELQDGSLAFINKGDGYPRGMQIDILGTDGTMEWRDTVFHYRNSTQYNVTFANLGGMAEFSDRILITGASEKALSYEPQADEQIFEKNLYIQALDKDFSNGKLLPERQLFQEEERIAEGNFDKDRELPEGAVDYGVKWLTNYKAPDYISEAHIVKISEDKMVILWEKSGKSAYYCVIDAKGNIVKEETEITGAKLTTCEQFIYDGTYLAWAEKSVSGKKKNIILHKLKVF